MSFTEINKFEIVDDTIKVTLIDITLDQKCFDFRIVKSAEVDHLLPAAIHIDDAYHPGRKARLVSGMVKNLHLLRVLHARLILLRSRPERISLVHSFFL